MQRIELTLAIIKPHAVKNPVALAHIRHVLRTKFVVVKTTRLHMDRELAASFYQEHAGKFFHNRLVTFMSSGVSDVHVLGGVCAVSAWRSLLGPTRVSRASWWQPESLRALHGLSDTRNVAHGSDSERAARREISFFFPRLLSWWAREGASYCGPLSFSRTDFQHSPAYSPRTH